MTYNFDPCNAVNTFDLVRQVSRKDFDYITTQEMSDLRTQYGHILLCDNCKDGLGVAIEEFSVGNDKFDGDRFKKNLSDLEVYTLG